MQQHRDKQVGQTGCLSWRLTKCLLVIHPLGLLPVMHCQIAARSHIGPFRETPHLEILALPTGTVRHQCTPSRRGPSEGLCACGVCPECLTFPVCEVSNLGVYIHGQRYASEECLSGSVLWLQATTFSCALCLFLYPSMLTEELI